MSAIPTSNSQYDIEALGWLLYQLVSGKAPDTSFLVNGFLRFPVNAQARISSQTLASLESIINKAIVASPDEYFRRAIEFVGELEALRPSGESPVNHILCTAQTSSAQQITVAVDTLKRFKAKPGLCPYQGLFAFREEDAQLFFGRETFVDQLVNMVQQKPIVLVTGPSGSGKSSVVHAGLVPYLRQSGEWEIASLRPGFEPIQALAATLSPFLVPQMTETERASKNQRLAKNLEYEHLSLLELVTQILENNTAHKQMLLVIDQFEELYTLCNDKVRNDFLDMILEATSAPIFQCKLRLM